MTSPWIAGTPLITAEIACRLNSPHRHRHCRHSLPPTFIDVSSGGEQRGSPNYSHSKTFNASVELIHCKAHEICNAASATVPLCGIPNDRSPVQASACLLSRNCLPRLSFIFTWLSSSRSGWSLPPLCCPLDSTSLTFTSKHGMI